MIYPLEYQSGVNYELGKDGTIRELYNNLLKKNILSLGLDLEILKLPEIYYRLDFIIHSDMGFDIKAKM